MELRRAVHEGEGISWLVARAHSSTSWASILTAAPPWPASTSLAILRRPAALGVGQSHTSRGGGVRGGAAIGGDDGGGGSGQSTSTALGRPLWAASKVRPEKSACSPTTSSSSMLEEHVVHQPFTQQLRQIAPPPVKAHALPSATRCSHSRGGGGDGEGGGGEGEGGGGEGEGGGGEGEGGGGEGAPHSTINRLWSVAWHSPHQTRLAPLTAAPPSGWAQ